MAYADKCFYFDWGNREIKLEDFDIYDSVTVRKRWLTDDNDQTITHLSIELWGKEEDGKRHEDAEIVLSRDNAMVLANKIMRAVAELDADEYLSDLHTTVGILKKAVGDDKFDEIEDKWRKYKLIHDPKGGIGGALTNFLNTPMGQDAAKKLGYTDNKSNTEAKNES